MRTVHLLCQKLHIQNLLYFQGPPSLRQFDADEFLKSLDHSGPQLTSGVKGDWEGLYKRFFRSNNFEGWYYNRQYEVNQKIQVLHMEALCQAVSFICQVFNVKWNILLSVSLNIC